MIKKAGWLPTGGPMIELHPKTYEMEEKPSCVCRICHRPLRNLKSVLLGMGPTCRGKQRPQQTYFDFNKKDLPDSTEPQLFDDVSKQIDLVRSKEGHPYTNVKHTWVHHSPDGFEWGYGGSGPAELALNILILFCDRDTAWRLHQDFKWQFIATMPKEGGYISAESIIAWIKNQLPTKGEKL